jgi:hypothetical protein
MVFAGSTILMTVLAVLAAGMASYLIGKWAFGKDTEVENRRRAAAQLAAKLTEMGLKQTPAFLIDYSVGDYSGMAMKIKQLADLFLHGESAVVAELDSVFNNVLNAKLKSETGRTLIAAKLADAAKVSDPAVTVATKAAVVA